MTSKTINENEIKFQYRLDIEGEYIPNVGDMITHREKTYRVIGKGHDYNEGLITIHCYNGSQQMG